jgi:glycosyltransferase involved in cell wall biosynthesis
MPRDRFRVLWVGAQRLFRPQPAIAPEANVTLFYGTYIPLQGIETIVRAAKLLEGDNVRVRIIGDGQERPAIEALAADLGVRSLELIDPVPIDELPEHIARASLCLGVFGTTPKAGRVIPNKVYECLAVGRPVLTADTPAVRQAFDGEVATVVAGDATALAASIRRLCADPVALEELGRRGHERYERDFSEAALARMLHACIDEVVPRRRALSGPRPQCS